MLGDVLWGGVRSKPSELESTVTHQQIPAVASGSQGCTSRLRQSDQWGTGSFAARQEPARWTGAPANPSPPHTDPGELSPNSEAGSCLGFCFQPDQKAFHGEQVGQPNSDEQVLWQPILGTFVSSHAQRTGGDRPKESA